MHTISDEVDAVSWEYQADLSWIERMFSLLNVGSPVSMVSRREHVILFNVYCQLGIQLLTRCQSTGLGWVVQLTLASDIVDMTAN